MEDDRDLEAIRRSVGGDGAVLCAGKPTRSAVRSKVRRRLVWGSCKLKWTPPAAARGALFTNCGTRSLAACSGHNLNQGPWDHSSIATRTTAVVEGGGGGGMQVTHAAEVGSTMAARRRHGEERRTSVHPQKEQRQAADWQFNTESGRLDSPPVQGCLKLERCGAPCSCTCWVRKLNLARHNVVWPGDSAAQSARCPVAQSELPTLHCKPSAKLGPRLDSSSRLQPRTSSAAEMLRTEYPYGISPSLSSAILTRSLAGLGYISAVSNLLDNPC